tara:strand:+ start:2257 stop:3516 length:1260 start_codon:yes stop_codon:yes gene_type:complete
MVSLGFSQNPITKAKGVSDPHIRVFNDTIYLFSGHDASPNDKLWVMKDWRVFSSTDLLDWEHVQTISPKDNYMDDNSIDCWAGDAATRNGKYYFYFSDRKRGIGVMQTNRLTEPFVDALGKPLVAPMHDPTIFIDDDENNTPYIVYGDKTDAYYIAELNDDMISVAENPKAITIFGEAWEKAPKWMDKNYLFKENDTYYLSWGRDYATSKNIYGPYKSAGSFGEGYNLDEFAHGSFFWWKGQFYHAWCYYIKEGYKFRETIITYCHIADDGSIVTDTKFLDKHFKNGVGQYDASWDKIEAEWFYEKSPEINKRGNKLKGFTLSNIKSGSWIKYANVSFSNNPTQIEVFLRNTKGKGKLEIRERSLSGALIGTISIKKDTTRSILCEIPKYSSKRNLYFKFIGNNNFSTELDYIKFTSVN